MRTITGGLTLLLAACVGGEKVTYDAGSDAGTDAGAAVVDAGPPTPLDTIFSIGVLENSAGVPQSAPLVALQFHPGPSGPAVVVAQRIDHAIALDGNASDWIGIPESTVPLLSRGGAVGMSQHDWDTECMALYGRTLPYDFGISEVAVRAAFDDTRIWFLVQWADPTENRQRDTWYLDGGVFVRSKENEDRLTLGFDIGQSTPAFEAIGCSGACHLHEMLGDVSDAGRAYRTKMHTNHQGETLDYWEWRAGTTDPMGAGDDGYMDETSRKPDGPNDWITQNQITPDAGMSDGGAADAGAPYPWLMSSAGINANPLWLFKPDAGPGAMPFDITGAMDGARLPGWVMQRASPNRDDVTAVGRWAAGHWTVEISRSLTTADPRDVQFPPR